ncbi:MAG: hypothetical protein H7335_18470 [Massilia sp.]|nr:hypothetical protein [Massilia sp.]
MIMLIARSRSAVLQCLDSHVRGRKRFCFFTADICHRQCRCQDTLLRAHVFACHTRSPCWISRDAASVVKNDDTNIAHAELIMAMAKNVRLTMPTARTPTSSEALTDRERTIVNVSAVPLGLRKINVLLKKHCYCASH